MSEKITFSAEDPDEIDSKKGRKEKANDKDGRKFVVPLPIVRNEKPESKPDAEVLRQAPKSFLEKVINNDAEKFDAKYIPEDTETNGAEVSQELQAEDASIEAVIIEQAEQSVAEDLHGGEEISLRDLAQVPLERDEHIVEEALELDSDAEVTREADAVEELPVIADLPAIETEPVLTNVDKTAEQPVATPVIPIQAPRSYRSRSRATASPVPPIIPPMPPIGGGNIPPVGGASSGHNPNYGSYTSGYGPNNNQNVAPSAPNVRKALDDAEWGDRQKGRREGVLAGLLVGGGIEHFRHKRREKKMEKHHQKELIAQRKRAEQLEYDYESAKQKQKAEQTRSEANFAQERLVTTAEAAKQAKELEELKKNQERLATQHAAELKVPEEELRAVVPKDHHIERSAWHNIEVDKHGRAVQESAIDYGHEYYKERAHEVGPQQQVDSAAGEVALVAAALSESSGHATTPSAPQNYSSVATPKAGVHAPQTTAQKVVRAITTPPSSPLATLVWLAVLIAVAAIIVAVTH